MMRYRQLFMFLVVMLMPLFKFEWISWANGASPRPLFSNAHIKYHRTLRQEEERAQGQRQRQEDRTKDDNDGQEFSYKTRHLNPSLCRGLSNEKCRELDNDMIASARSLKKIVTESSGFIRVLVLLLQFSDHKTRNLPGIENYKEIFNSHEESDIVPTGSVSRFVHFNSYGKVKMTAEIVNWTITDNTEVHYSFDNSGLSHDFRFAYYPILDQLDRDGFDFSRFDQDGDGYIDTLMVLHSGYPAETHGSDCINARPAKQRIWAHAVASQKNNWRSKQHSRIGANAYCVASALYGLCHARPARIGVIVHEWLHIMGLPDMKDTGGDAVGRGIGEFDIMSSAHGINGKQVFPPHLSPWNKIKLGWLDPIEIQHDGVYTIEASELAPAIYKISKGFAPNEYLLIENRQPILWDRLMWGGGILIWHVDLAQVSLEQRGFPGMEGWPGNGHHYEIALLQADGKYDLEKGKNGGDDGDFWKDTSGPLGPGRIEQVASHLGTYPNTNSYQLGDIQQTGLVLSDFSKSGTVMSFRVTGVGPAPPTIPSSLPPSSSPTIMTSLSPSEVPTEVPTSLHPSHFPTTMQPSALPTWTASSEPSSLPSAEPSSLPSFSPTAAPSSSYPSSVPTNLDSPSTAPTVIPSAFLFTGSDNNNNSGNTLPPSVIPNLLPTIGSQPDSNNGDDDNDDINGNESGPQSSGTTQNALISLVFVLSWFLFFQ